MICPYCHEEASSIGAGDEAIDYCYGCEMVIEGQTKREKKEARLIAAGHSEKKTAYLMKLWDQAERRMR